VPVLIPALVLAVPFLDTILAITRRLGSGRSMSSPDKLHLHHRLIEIGHSHRRAVLVMYAWSALAAFAVVGLALLPRATVFTVLGVGVALVLVGTLAGGRRGPGRRRRDLRRVALEEEIVYDFTSRKRTQGPR
jgi:UDP-GlcNAc:undecaprenyl-phosphate GlcNAc-1-phosphate transferase